MHLLGVQPTLIYNLFCTVISGAQQPSTYISPTWAPSPFSSDGPLSCMDPLSPAIPPAPPPGTSECSRSQTTRSSAQRLPRGWPFPLQTPAAGRRPRSMSEVWRCPHQMADSHRPGSHSTGSSAMSWVDKGHYLRPLRTAHPHPLRTAHPRPLHTAHPHPLRTAHPRPLPLQILTVRSALSYVLRRSHLPWGNFIGTSLLAMVVTTWWSVWIMDSGQVSMRGMELRISYFNVVRVFRHL